MNAAQASGGQSEQRTARVAKPQGTIGVREASAADREAAVALISPGTARGRISLALLAARQGTLWVAVAGEDAQLVGLLLGTIQVEPEGERLVGYIQELLVHPDYRRLGVANHLLDAAERYFLRELRLAAVMLVTSPENDAALRLYRGRGYTLSQVRLTLTPPADADHGA
jgi:ribosomal protein S18 acetylase RimI-like enzyme